MSTVQPNAWEGPVRLQETKKDSKIVTIKSHPAGKYSSEDVSAILKALLGAPKGVKFDGWKFWLDGDFSIELEKGQDVTAAQLAKIVKEADHVMLAYIKRPFPQPKLKFTKGKPSGPTRSAKADLLEL